MHYFPTTSLYSSARKKKNFNSSTVMNNFFKGTVFIGIVSEIPTFLLR